MLRIVRLLRQSRAEVHMETTPTFIWSLPEKIDGSAQLYGALYRLPLTR
jgi:hypothetical protein